MFGVFFLICLFVNSGMCSESWAVNYLNKMKCALKGSTAVLSGSFTYPQDLTLTDRFWTINPVKDKETPDLSKDPEFEGRVQYILGNNQTFFLKLYNVSDKDEHVYCIRIVTNTENGKYLGYPGINLKVTELRVEVPEEVVERNSSVLVCKTTCSFASSTIYTWYKNKRPLSESFSTNKLLLQSVSSDDAGSYSCAVRENADLPSPAVTLNVRYPPKKTSVSISGSGVIVEGDSVNLTCSSESNPPVYNYTWFKENETSSVGSGQTFRALHYGNFYCLAENKYGSQRSAAVSVIFSDGQNKVHYITAGIVSSLICICVVVVIIGIIRRKTADSEVKRERTKQENISVAVTDQIPVRPTACDPKTANQNDVMYASITHVRPSRDQSTGDDEEVQYASVHHHENTEKNNVDAEYGNVIKHCSSRSNDGLVEDSSVIYSSIRVT